MNQVFYKGKAIVMTFLKNEFDDKINQVFSIFNARELSVDKKESGALTLVPGRTEYQTPWLHNTLTTNYVCSSIDKIKIS